MTVLTGKHALLKMLQAKGVGYIFGNPGTSETPIMDALESYPDLRCVLAAQEGVAVGTADGYARASGTPSLVLLHIEVGLANGISLLHGARLGGIPMVVVAANKDASEVRPWAHRPGADGPAVHQVERRRIPPGSRRPGDSACVQRGQESTDRAGIRLDIG